MIRFENAKLMEPEELTEMIDAESDTAVLNPTIDRLMFMETKDKEKDGQKIPGKVFPVFLEAWMAKDINADDPEAKGLVFMFCIAQTMDGKFSMLRVVVPATDFGKNKRFWDKPPKAALRKETPWKEEPPIGIVQ